VERQRLEADPLLQPGRSVPTAISSESIDGCATRDGKSHDESFRAGTTSVVAADAEGWVVSMTPRRGP